MVKSIIVYLFFGSVFFILLNCNRPMNRMFRNEPELISDQFDFTEGPAADSDGNIYFTDQPNNSIWKYGVDNKLSIFMEPAGRANGMYFSKNGNLIVCAEENNELWSIAKDGSVQVLVKDVGERKLNAPNDVWVHPNGNIYFTDPHYPRDFEDKNAARVEGEHVYLFHPKSGNPKAVITDLVKPNGIVGTADGKKLYVADIDGKKIFSYSFDKEGKPVNKKLFVDQGSDGMTIDKQGNVYLTGANGVSVFDENGNPLGEIRIPKKWTANVCFGGRNHDRLFITASNALYVVDMK